LRDTQRSKPIEQEVAEQTWTDFSAVHMKKRWEAMTRLRLSLVIARNILVIPSHLENPSILHHAMSRLPRALAAIVLLALARRAPRAAAQADLAPAPAPVPAPPVYPTASWISLMAAEQLTNADIWDPELKIFTANYAFQGEGFVAASPARPYRPPRRPSPARARALLKGAAPLLPTRRAALARSRLRPASTHPLKPGIEGAGNGTEATVRAGGGAWNTVPDACANSTLVNLFTTTQTTAAVAGGWGYPVYNGSGMPVVFSWPLLSSTANASDFLFTLSTGEQVSPGGASIVPNFEGNERHVIVLFGEMGNRLGPEEPGAVWVTKVEVVDDGTPIMAVGPDGVPVSTVGLSYDAGCCTSYGENAAGPRLVAAKLSAMSTTGEATAANGASYPNDCVSLYGDDARWRLRMYTSGAHGRRCAGVMLPTAPKKLTLHLPLSSLQAA
jgi:hypothetical protein